MEVGILSMRYAKALLAYAEEHKAEDKIYKELSTLAHSFQTVKGFTQALDNPILPAEEKLRLICTAADGDQKSSDELIRFIRLVLKEHREAYLHFMSLMYLDIYRKKKHIGVGRLISAVPVNKATEERIRESAAHILHAHMELETVIDPSIEGGFIFDINDYRLDASIATQLKKVRQQFIEKNRRIV